MKILNKLTLRNRMIYGFGIVLICFVGALIYGIYGLSSNGSQLERIVEISREERIANNIKENFLNSVIAFKSHVDNGDQKNIKDFDNNNKLLKENISTIKSVSNNQQRKEYVDLISDDVNLVSERFEQVKFINNELSKDYISLAEIGYRMLNDLNVIKKNTNSIENIDVNYEVTQSIEYLLFARLHAAKFFNFHTEVEFLEYQREYNLFMKGIERISIISDIELYQEEYISLKSDMISYNDDMTILYTKINTMDRLLKEVEEINPRVNGLVNKFVDSAELELNETQIKSAKSNNQYNLVMGILSIIASLLSIYVVIKILETVLEPIKYLNKAFKELTHEETSTDFRLNILSNDEIGEMSKSFNEFMIKLGQLINEVKLSNYIKTAHNDMESLVRDEMNIAYVSGRLLHYIINYTKAVVGSFYIREDNNFVNYSTYAHTLSEFDKTFEFGENYLGEVADEGVVKVVNDLETIVLKNDKRLKTGVIDQSVQQLVIIPCLFEGGVNGLVELGYMHKISDDEALLFEALAENLGALIHSAKSRIKMKILLDRTMHQAEELQMQKEELKQSNEELEEQTRALKESEAKLQAQQEELRVSNEELEERSKQLEIQRSDLDIKNKAIMNSQKEVLLKAQELELVNRYKTEFLANMSHELRTPLNSILVLSQLLESRNNSKLLTDKEVEFASTINRSGNDLLTLINDVLDLSKVEAGKIELHIENVTVENIIRDNISLFEPLTDIKKIELKVDNQFEKSFVLKSDSLRINQIIKNLMSNAIKFTQQGSVKLIVRRPYQNEINRFNRTDMNDIVFEVKDTGIGIPLDKQELIFEAFKQNDGSTARSYGGTGLGLTIALQLSKKMKGTIYIDSIDGEGSSFVFITPVDLSILEIEDIKVDTELEGLSKLVPVLKDIVKSEKIKAETIDIKLDVDKMTRSKLLIIEDDIIFANLLKDLCEGKGYETFVAHSGYEGIEKALVLLPDGIILDVGLPDIKGIEVAEILENTKETSSIPIHIISGNDADTSKSMPKSIIGFLKKPVDIKSIYQTLAKIEAYSNKGLKKLLVVGSCGGEDFDSFKNLGDIDITRVRKGREAIKLLTEDNYGCIVLDSELEDMRGVEFLATISQKIGEKIPVIIYSESDIESHEYNQMKELTSSIILKSSKSKDRLTDEVNLFLHDMKSSLEQFSTQSALTKDNVKENIKDKIIKEDSLKESKVLIADDDDRNVFALSHALEQLGMDIVVAEDGRRALDLFKTEMPDIILMDIMMPEMDGYEAIRMIREEHKGKDIPIIALTAKAMREDREKCIKAGANDYMTKPFDINKLTSLLKVWLS